MKEKKFPRSKFKESLMKNKSITDKETQPKLISLRVNSILTNISPGVGRRDSEGTVGTQSQQEWNVLEQIRTQAVSV